jgi:hypothetical protein
MRKATTFISVLGLAIGLALLGAACSTDSPTAPEQNPPPPGGDVTPTNFRITINADPDEILVDDSANPITLDITVRHRDTNAPPASGTTMTLSSNLGGFDQAGTQRSAAVALFNGRAAILFFPGSIPGLALITGQLGTSIGQETVDILGVAADPFISSVQPASGPQGGGTNATISGERFADPLRVFFAGLPALVTSSGATTIRVRTPAVPDSVFSTESCDSDGNGSLDGTRKAPTPVDVTVEIDQGDGSVRSDTLTSGFTYNPADTTCSTGAAPPPV